MTKRYDLESPNIIDLHICMSNLLECGREELAAECACRLLGWASEISKSDPGQATAEAVACMERLEHHAPDRCTRAMYFSLSQIEMKSGHTNQARKSLKKLKSLNDGQLGSWGADLDDREPPSPGRVLELLAWAQLACCEGKRLESLIFIKRALNFAWTFDARIQALVIGRFREIAMWGGDGDVERGMAELQDRLVEVLPEENLRISDPMLWV